MLKTYKLEYRYFSMNFQFYLEKLMDSGDFQKFKKENPNAYLCSGFFSIDKEKGLDNQQHLDYSPLQILSSIFFDVSELSLTFFNIADIFGLPSLIK